MNIERTLFLKSGDNSISLEVDSFRYSGGINRGYEIEMFAFADKSTSIEKFIGARFEFNYGGSNIDSATIRGFVREIVTGFDNKQNRVQFKIIGKSIISYLGEYYYNKMYSEASVDNIINDMLLSTCNTYASFIGAFRPLAFQSNKTQVLSGNALEFFNYQFNSHGFYIVDDSNKDKDIIKVYSQPQDLGNVSGEYDINKTVGKDSISYIKNFKLNCKKNSPTIEILGYDVNEGYAKNVNSNPFNTSHTTGETFLSEDAQELTTRYNASRNSLNKLSELNLVNYSHREGDLVDINTHKKQKYWVYESEIIGKVETTKHWDIKTSLKLLSVEDKPWYPPLANKPKPMQATGFKYSSDKPLGKFNSLPIETNVPFNDKADTAHVRNVSMTSSKSGGTFSRPQKDSSVVLMTPDNANEPISLGYSSDAKADEHISSKNIQDSGIHSAGGVALNFTRNRAGQDYSKVSLQSNDKQGRVSEVALGGEPTASHQEGFTKNTFSDTYPNLEGIIKRSVDSALDIAAGDIELDHSGIEKISISRKDGRDSYSRTTNANTHLERYFVKNFSENKEDGKNVYDNFISSVKINTAKKDDNYQTTIHWDIDKPADNTIELDGKSEVVSKESYNFEKEQTSYDFKIKLDKKSELSIQADLNEDIQQISIGAEKLKKARTYGLSIGWTVTNEASLTIDGQDVAIGKKLVFIELQDSKPLTLKFTQAEHTSIVTIKLCPLETITSDLKPLPKADELTQMDDSGIYHESNLEQHIVYTDKLVESEAHPENDILTWHDGLKPKNFNNLNQAKQQQSYEANELVKPQNYFDESLQRAKDGKPRLESAERTGADKLAQGGGLDYIASTANLPTDQDSKVLKNMSDRDASVLCELVYEEAVWEAIVNEKDTESVSLSKVMYDNQKVKDKYKAILLATKSEDILNALELYYEHYSEVLSKYKLVSTSNSLGNDVGYYGIAVAYVEDEDNKGIYVINRGTRQDTLKAVYQDLISSDVIDMGVLGKTMPVTIVSNHAKAGIEFTKNLLESRDFIKHIAFSGHSLGGSVAQMQVVYFLNDERTENNQSIGFEPFGVKNEVSPSISYMTEEHKLYYLTLNPLKALNSWVCSAGIDWGNCDNPKDIADRVVINYAGMYPAIRFTSFGRKGDIIANLAKSIGAKIEIDSAGEDKNFLELHSMSNYRYQEYTSKGKLIETKINKHNVDILKDSGNTSQTKKYKLCFNTPKFTNYEKI